MPPRGELLFQIAGLTGMNSSYSQSRIADTEAVLLENFEVTKYGSIRKREPIRHIHTLTAQASATTVLGTFGNQILIKDSSAGLTVLTYSLPSSGLTITDEDYFSDLATIKVTGYLRYNNLGYLLTDENIWTWDGTTLTEDTSSVTGTTMAVFKDRLFVANENRIYYSAVADFSTWGASAFFDVNPGDNDSIRHIRVYQDRLVIFKANSVWVMNHAADPANWNLKIVNNAFGAYTAEEADGLLYISTNRGIYVTDTLQFKNISEPIGNPANGSKLLYIHEKRCLFYGQTYTYHLDTAGWTKRNYPFAGTGTLALQPFTKVTEGYYMCGQSGLFATHKELFILNLADPPEYYSDQTGPSGSENIVSTLITKRYNLESPESSKRGKYLIIDAIADIEFEVDFEDLAITETTLQYRFGETSPSAPSSTTGLAVQPVRESQVYQLDPIRGSKSYKMPGPGYFREVQIELIDSGVSPLEILSMNMAVQGKRILAYRQTP